MDITIVKRGWLHFAGEFRHESWVSTQGMSVFKEAAGPIEQTFKLREHPFVVVCYFDRPIAMVVGANTKLERGKFYEPLLLLSDSDRLLTQTLNNLRFQPRLVIVSVDRREYVGIVVFGAEGAVLSEDTERNLLSLTAESELPTVEDPPFEVTVPDRERELVGV